jgi:hypothetical protein
LEEKKEEKDDEKQTGDERKTRLDSELKKTRMGILSLY